uniref:NADH dehydrogenase subunit 6 n=1 Tax=Cypridopsis vidua TaxID=230730 RepID=A0A0N7AYN8_9CRUS|nr:NADH dehydrogenase subunit 6 [Cypridopsis vidua]AJY78607.1 NADH dehydrogenase subunit 6 [Cypridopsis vidua]
MFLKILMLSLMMIFMNSLFLMSSHPLIMGFILMLQTLLFAVLSGIIMSSYWYSYILILVFLGGLLILFVYVSSMASNEKLNFSPLALMIALISFCFILFSINFNILNMFKGSDSLVEKSFIWLFSEPSGMLASFLIIYLFIILIAIVKITKWWGGALRPL